MCQFLVSGVFSHTPEGRRNEIGPGQEFVDTAVRMVVDDLGDDIGQVGVRFDTTMRLISVVPHEHYGDLDERRFTCEVCGETFADAVARLD